MKKAIALVITSFFLVGCCLNQAEAAANIKKTTKKTNNNTCTIKVGKFATIKIKL